MMWRDEHNYAKEVPPSSPPIDGGVSDALGLSSNEYTCRMCLTEEDAECTLISPCHCTGSMRYVHQSCIQQWFLACCQDWCLVCKSRYVMQNKLRPIVKWTFPVLSSIEWIMLMARIVNVCSLSVLFIVVSMVAMTEIRYSIVVCFLVGVTAFSYCEWTLHNYYHLSVPFYLKKIRMHNSDIVFQNARNMPSERQ